MSVRTLQEHFRPTIESIRAARHVAVGFLSDQPQAVRESVELGVSELATNVVRHAHTDFDLEVRVVDRTVRVQVADQSRATPKIQGLSGSDSHGRGLQIVRGLSDGFGIEWRPGIGKSIWFEINN